MNWFKHDTDATQDAKIRKLLIRYGAVGYAIYFHCLELIAAETSETNLTFQLEHDSEIIADNLHIKGTAEKSGIDIVQEIMRYIVELNLFQESGGQIFCFKLLKRLDTSMTSNPKFRDLITQAKGHHDGIMTPSCKPSSLQDKPKEQEDTQEARTRGEEVSSKVEGAPPLDPGSYSRAVFDAWQELGESVYQPANLLAFLNSTWAKVRPSFQGIHSDDILAAIRNFRSIATAPAGKYWWERRVGLERWAQEHLTKFLPANFREADFLLDPSDAPDPEESRRAAERDRREEERRQKRIEELVASGRFTREEAEANPWRPVRLVREEA